MAKVYDVAKYILEHKGSMSTMKLQKLTYYCQAWSLAWDGVPLFDEDFEAWANGPVCPELYNCHRGMFLVDEKLFDNQEDYEFTPTAIETIDIVLSDYGDDAPHELSELTHKERPWKETRGSLPPGAASNRVIEKGLMEEYYGGLYEI